jgi:ribosome-binding factor A
MKMFKRERMQIELRRVLSEWFLFEVRDSKVKDMTVTRCEVSKDGKYAKVYVIAHASEEENREIVKHINEKMKGFARKYIAKHVKARVVPEIHFFYDKGIDASIEMQKKFEDLESKEEDVD